MLHNVTCFVVGLAALVLSFALFFGLAAFIVWAIERPIFKPGPSFVKLGRILSKFFFGLAVLMFLAIVAALIWSLYGVGCGIITYFSKGHIHALELFNEGR